jgi:hypothetical protein
MSISWLCGSTAYPLAALLLHALSGSFFRSMHDARTTMNAQSLLKKPYRMFRGDCRAVK